MKSFTIYHNPRCGKSRDTLKRLTNARVQPTVIEYLKTPPDVATLDALCKALDLPPQAIVRYQEPVAQQLGLAKDDARTRSEWLKVIAENPSLLERPIVVTGTRAVIGRPPENVDSLL
jgi:arsenate reductase